MVRRVWGLYTSRGRRLTALWYVTEETCEVQGPFMQPQSAGPLAPPAIQAFAIACLHRVAREERTGRGTKSKGVKYYAPTRPSCTGPEKISIQRRRLRPGNTFSTIRWLLRSAPFIEMT